MRLHVPNPAFVVTHQTGDDGVSSIHIGNVDAGPVAELILHPGQHVEVSRDDFVYLHIPGFGCELLLADPAEAVAAPADPRGDFLKAGWAFSHAIADGDVCSDGTCLRCRLAKVLADVEHQAAQAPPPAEQTIPPSYDGPGRFRKKPVVIEAIQFDGTANGAKRIQAAFPDHKIEAEVKSIGCLWPEPGWSPPAKLYIPTLEGGMTAGKGDWIIRGVKGEVYPCKPDIFAATYESVPPAAPEPSCKTCGDRGFYSAPMIYPCDHGASQPMKAS